MSERYTVGEIIEVLTSTYKKDDKILVMWWDKTLPYLDYKEITDEVWQKALDSIEEGSLDIPSGMIWDTIAEKLLEEIEKSGGNNEHTEQD